MKYFNSILLVSLVIITNIFLITNKSEGYEINDYEELKIKFDRLQKDLIDLEKEVKQSVPVGNIVAFHGDIKDLSPKWVVCDGRKIEDPESPLHNKNTPNMTDRFLMGVPPQRISEIGGKATITKDGQHKHVVNIAGSGGHDHGGKTVGFAGWRNDRVNYNIRHGYITDYHQDKKIGRDGHHTHDASVSHDGLHDHGGENRPPYYGVVYIIHIK